ncbi:MAG: hypothetical protein KC635_07915 [Myxococcales bacterium]|nr:hypothetical protein [Myxococcales bacterium]MCB9737147.1 hypothetical protein [Deltaproteobacteria bacterium]
MKQTPTQDALDAQIPDLSYTHVAPGADFAAMTRGWFSRAPLGRSPVAVGTSAPSSSSLVVVSVL